MRTGAGLACAEGLFEGVCDELGAHVVGEGPADDAPQAKVDSAQRHDSSCCAKLPEPGKWGGCRVRFIGGRSRSSRLVELSFGA